MAENVAALLAEAATWVGTPYHPLQACKGVGTDCLGWIVQCVNVVTGSQWPYPPRDGAVLVGLWWQHTLEERLLQAVQQRPEVRRVPTVQGQPGDVVLLALDVGRPLCHCALVLTPLVPLDAALIQHAPPGGRVAVARFRPVWSLRAVVFRMRIFEERAYGARAAGGADFG